MSDWLPLSSAQLAHFHFLRPWWLLSLVPLLIALRVLWNVRSPLGKWRKIIAPELLQAMLLRQGRSGWFNPVTVAILVAIVAAFAAAGPAWKQQDSPFSEDVAALVIALDVSASMRQQDIQPSRLERAKQKVQDLLAQRPGGLVGLVVYAGSAHSVIPLTNDPDVVKNFLDAIDPAMMPRKGKFPEKALPIADRILGDSPVPGTILVIGDGISAQTHAGFSGYFSQNQHQLLLLGVGSDTTEAETNGVAEDAFIPLERNALQKLADENGGYYQALTLDKDDVANLGRRVDSHYVIVEDGSRPWIDEGYSLLYLVALIMLLWFRRGWTLHWCLAPILITALITPEPAFAETDSGAENAAPAWFMDLWLTPDQQGRFYLERGDYARAAARFEDIAWRGIAYYRAENFIAASEMFSRIETAAGLFNLANAWAHSRNYVYAVQTYDRLLELEPGHASALKNRALIQKIIDQVNLLSASQQAENSDSSRELSDQQPLTGDGAERQDFIEREVEQLSAEQILLDDKINEQWMRQVQKDPSFFLGVKFQMQLQREPADE